MKSKFKKIVEQVAKYEVFMGDFYWKGSKCTLKIKRYLVDKLDNPNLSPTKQEATEAAIKAQIAYTVDTIQAQERQVKFWQNQLKQLEKLAAQHKVKL